MRALFRVFEYLDHHPRARIGVLVAHTALVAGLLFAPFLRLAATD